MDIFAEANSKLESFINNYLTSYHKLRNFDYGVKNRSNISKTSKYITHRILYEYEIIDKLKCIDKKKKFTDEVLWRIYWKGYLEKHKSIWFDYKKPDNNSYDSTIFENAKKGQTGIKCFDTWVEELREDNYLHNHSRMWFASIWLFTLGLPWKLGAKFFMQHLLDGDAASNTLSWRWVAGMHTNNKPYIATKENINKYTANRFINTPMNILNQASTIIVNKHQCNGVPTQKNYPNSKYLFMFDNDLHIKNRTKLFNSYSKVYILFNQVNDKNLALSDNVFNFKLKLLNNINRLIPNSKVLDFTDMDELVNDIKNIDVIYPGVGDNLDFMNSFAFQNQTNINYIYRKEDLISWDLANSGFYKFKTSFYKINNIK